MKRDVHLHSHPSRVEHWRHVAEIIAFAGAAVWALYVFVYQERIKPESATPRVQPSFSVETHRLKAGRTYVKVHLELKNTGESIASVAAVNVNVYGTSFGLRPASFIEHPAPGITQTGRALPPAPPQFLSSFTNEWHALGQPKTLTLSPGANFDESFAFAIPDGLVDSVKIYYTICWTHPTDRQWNLPLERQADGSYRFVAADTVYRHVSDGFICTGNNRGEPFPL